MPKMGSQWRLLLIVIMYIIKAVWSLHFDTCFTITEEGKERTKKLTTKSRWTGKYICNTLLVEISKLNIYVECIQFYINLSILLGEVYCTGCLFQ